jgi:hypothetical protein
MYWLVPNHNQKPVGEGGGEKCSKTKGADENQISIDKGKKTVYSIKMRIVELVLWPQPVLPNKIKKISLRSVYAQSCLTVTSLLLMLHH